MVGPIERQWSRAKSDLTLREVPLLVLQGCRRLRDEESVDGTGTGYYWFTEFTCSIFLSHSKCMKKFY